VVLFTAVPAFPFDAAVELVVDAVEAPPDVLDPLPLSPPQAARSRTMDIVAANFIEIVCM
jgi:hypothetical protein